MNPINRGITKLAPDQRREVVSRYLAGDPSPKLAKEFGVSIPTVLKYVRMEGENVRSLSEAGRKYYCNDCFFHEIDSERKAYWLGFITADGSITWDAEDFEMGLARRDRHHLERFVSDINGDYPVHDGFHDGHPASSVLICSPEFVEGLKKHGIRPLKTYDLTFPLVPHDLLRHYIRGYLDGDGWVVFGNSWYTRQDGIREKEMAIGFCGLEGFLTRIRSILEANCEIGRNRIVHCKETKMLYRYSIKGSRQLVGVANFLYEDATVYLPRKRDPILDYYNALSKYRGQLRFR